MKSKKNIYIIKNIYNINIYTLDISNVVNVSKFWITTSYFWLIKCTGRHLTGSGTSLETSDGPSVS